MAKLSSFHGRWPDRPIEELAAGDAFRNSLVERADERRNSTPLWHGWALMDAFLAGVDWARDPDNRLKK